MACRVTAVCSPIAFGLKFDMNVVLRVAVLALPPSGLLIYHNRAIPVITLFHVEIIKMVTIDIVTCHSD